MRTFICWLDDTLRDEPDPVDTSQRRQLRPRQGWGSHLWDFDGRREELVERRRKVDRGALAEDER